MMQTAKSSKSKQNSSPTSGTNSGSKTTPSPCGCGCGGGGGCGCGCQGHSHSDGCCKLTCFERPSYFCGQLLSDADLTLEETYFREKNKLYHRTIDGFGVVCGLRMKCDCNCTGHILIGDGFAIDCCGNDLVVCDQKSFDVIGELRKKKWLIEAPEDPCKDEEFKERERDCRFKKCYYIGACYTEEPVDYVTPYTTECTPGPGPCQPTRVRESVYFQIYDELPERPNPIKDIEKRIERCFSVFREGQFARGLQKLSHCILDVLCLRQKEQGDPAEKEKAAKEHRIHSERQHENPRHLFLELQALFLHQLRICPDQYNCDLERQVCKLCVPREDQKDERASALECFTKLFELIQKYVFSCVLAEFAFDCPQPTDPCCVLIGAVEVENGRMTRVINYPRWYLWSFSNFFEVLTYTLANEAACGKNAYSASENRGDKREPCNDGCCPDVEVDLCTFLNLFAVENRAPEYAALSSVKAIQAVRSALVSGFDFIKPRGVAPAVFDNMSLKDANSLAERLNFPLKSVGEPSSESPDPLTALLSNLIHRGSDAVAVFQEKRGGSVASATRFMDAPARAVDLSDHEARIASLELELKRLRAANEKRGRSNE